MSLLSHLQFYTLKVKVIYMDVHVRCIKHYLETSKISFIIKTKSSNKAKICTFTWVRSGKEESESVDGSSGVVGRSQRVSLEPSLWKYCLPTLSTRLAHCI